jgi:hypothetical protein
MLDVERYAELMANGSWPRWNDVQEFDARWSKVEPGRVLGFYIPDWVWDASLDRPSLTGLRGPLVASEYGTNPAGLGPSALYIRQGGDTSDKWHRYGGRSPEILQYGSKCALPGTSGGADINAFRGTFAQLTELLTKKTGATNVPTLDKTDVAVIADTDAVFSNKKFTTDFATNPELSLDQLLGRLWTDAHDAALRSQDILNRITAMASSDPVNEQVIIDGVLAGLAAKPTQEIVDVLRAVLTPQQFDDLAEALNTPSAPPA